MGSISQFTTNLKTLETNIFNVTTYLEALDNNNSISEDLTSLISSTEVSNLINSITSNAKLLSEYLEPLIKMAKIEYYKHKNSQTMEQYARFSIDSKEPIKENNQKPIFVSYEDLLKNHPVKPIKRRVEFDFNGTCPHCGAPKEFIYNNNHKNQFMCKICSGAFSVHPTYNDEISLRCPYCNFKLFLHHDRADYDVLVCPNDKCSFCLNNLKNVQSGNGEDLKVNKSFYKLKYTYRFFDFNLDDINNSKTFSIKPKINLSSIRQSKWTLGLILTYYVNYGLSARKTARILKEIHGIDISYQTVFNYIEAVTAITENLNFNFKYNLSNTTTFDETYIKVNGKNTYVFFGSDTTSKIITSYRVFPHRTAKNAIITLKESYDKFKYPPTNWTVITDANPIYNATQLFF